MGNLINNDVVNINYNCDCCIIVNKIQTYWFQLDLELTVVGHLFRLLRLVKESQSLSEMDL